MIIYYLFFIFNLYTIFLFSICPISIINIKIITMLIIQYIIILNIICQPKILKKINILYFYINLCINYY
ncbi:hypothetical protein CO115_03575 [Candidatus Falkowbacteria bacterium CG_4_9_14_3_um_filter_36_9]|nr:MAG: hypothetical protein COZ73_04345 [Candidatus Falkowbacteria bacterium CG_4_8_14_3_um_filter_36_11]PJA10942.1 MAG: hypothetical protein COX67_02410 [Candidatus Falkowbacteria bacterium CG_4_10_14_0_2_um_filter_36_22]PJB18898.1 MAG: hypothetical protein CO115_03575 [Candidatus Falkowbacteria bacterium CG_4_9_14_3_um_filter_36_9]